MPNKEALKVLHDALMANKSEADKHDSTTCPLCAMSDIPGGAVTTFTEEELRAAVDQAVAALQARVTELEQSQKVSDVESAKAAAIAEFKPQMDDLQTKLDEAVLKAQAAEKEATDIKAWLESEATAKAEADAVAARKDERLTKIREAASFPEEYLTQNIDRFAAMSDDDFEVALESWKTIAPAKAGEELPSETALHAGRESVQTTGSAVKDLLALRQTHRIDLTTL